MLICMGCMREYEDDLAACPHCGFVKDTPAKETCHLSPGAILQKRFIVGKVLGHGGFGVTYLGYDALLERKIAIKEYLPTNFSTRMPGETKLTIFQGESEELFDAGLQSFIKESHQLAKFNDLPGIVSIYDSFAENNTGYIVMEYLEGRTVKEALNTDGVFAYDDALRIILAILSPLKEVHKTGIIHRDIAPDNIFLTNDGDIKLLDFGAARYAASQHTKSLTVILKPGYAPEEQYRSRGNQGPWSDIYAVACTFYKMLTGITPEESLERRGKDTVAAPSKLGVKLPKSAENAILNAMNVIAEDRTRSAEAFEEALTADDVTRNKVKQKREDSGRVPLWLKILFGILGAGVVAVFALVANGMLYVQAGRLYTPWSIEDGYVYAPFLLRMTADEARAAAESEGLLLEVSGSQFHEWIPRDTVMSQTPQSGRHIQHGDTIYVVISGGPEYLSGSRVMPYVLYKTEEDAIVKLDEMYIVYEIAYATSDTVAEGCVISQSMEPGHPIEYDTIVTLTINRAP